VRVGSLEATPPCFLQVRFDKLGVGFGFGF
jgi:hypothetical protein